jgi:hypothetical protein
MKPRSLPDWFGPVFAWIITAVVLTASVMKPEGVYVNQRLKFFPLLLAIALTAGFVAMQRFKKKYQEEFEDLGSPYLFGSPFEGRTWRFQGYLFSLRFLRLKDRVVTVGFITMLSLSVIGMVWLLSIPRNA